MHSEARDELVATSAWYSERSAQYASQFLDEFEQLATSVVDFPNAGAPYLYSARRRLFHDFPFQLVYVVLGGCPILVAVASTSRRPGYWRDRLPRA
jgi:toxin ParE1/3/4